MVGICPGFILNFKLMAVDHTEAGFDHVYQLVCDGASKLVCSNLSSACDLHLNFYFERFYYCGYIYGTEGAA